MDWSYLPPSPICSGSTHFPLPTQICPLVHEISHRWWHLFLLTWASPFYIGLGQRWCLACSCLWLEWSAHLWLSECCLCMACLAADFPTSLQGGLPLVVLHCFSVTPPACILVFFMVHFYYTEDTYIHTIYTCSLSVFFLSWLYNCLHILLKLVICLFLLVLSIDSKQLLVSAAVSYTASYLSF